MFDDDLTHPVGRWALWLSRAVLPEDEAGLRAVGADLDASPFGAPLIGGSPPGDQAIAAALLDGSERLLVGTSITNVWTEDPAELAASSARLAAAHGDRFVLGLGAGHAPAVEKTGQAYVKPFSKVASFLDALDAADPPVPPKHRALAALGPRMLELSRDRTLGALPYLTTPQHTRRAREIVGADALLVPEQKVVLETDAVRARAVARATLKYYFELPNYTSNLVRLGWPEDSIRNGGSDELVDALALRGEPGSIVERLAEHLDAGADHVAVQPLHPDRAYPREQIEALAAVL